MPRDPAGKVLDWRSAQRWRAERTGRVAFTNGVFDLLHPGHVDVLLSHSPPLGVNDDADDRAHVGLAGLREYLERERPAMLLHGHTYPSLPVERWGETEVRHVRGHRFVTLPTRVASRPSG